MALSVGTEIAALPAPVEGGPRRAAAPGFAGLMAALVPPDDAMPALAQVMPQPAMPQPAMAQPGMARQAVTLPGGAATTVTAEWPWAMLAAAAEEADALAGQFQLSTVPPPEELPSDTAEQPVPALDSAAAFQQTVMPAPLPVMPLSLPPAATMEPVLTAPALTTPVLTTPASAAQVKEGGIGDLAASTAEAPAPTALRVATQALPAPVSPVTREPAPAAGAAQPERTPPYIALPRQEPLSRADLPAPPPLATAAAATPPAMVMPAAGIQAVAESALPAAAARPAELRRPAPAASKPAPEAMPVEAQETPSPQAAQPIAAVAPSVENSVLASGARPTPSYGVPVPVPVPVPLAAEGVAAPLPAPVEKPALPAPMPIVIQPAEPDLAARADAPQAAAAPLAWRPHQVTEAGQQIALRAARASAQGVDTVSVDLRPPELGRVELRLTFHEGKVQVTMVAERAETFEALRQDRANLEQQMQQVGLDLGGGGLDLRHGRLPREAPDETRPIADTAHAAAGNEDGTDVAAPQRPRSDSLIDLIA